LTVLASAAFGSAVFVTAVAMIMAISASVRSASLAPPQPGEEAPEFSLPNLDGNSIALSDFRGKRVVIVFWADWCQECKPLVDGLNELRAEGIPVLAINVMESSARAQAAAARQWMKYDVLMDRSGDVTKLYRVQSLPNVFVVDERGIVSRQTYDVPDVH
jgi:peroxiredoxin